MTPERFAEIQKKYKRVEELASKAEGAREQILVTLKTKYSISSEDELQERIAEQEKELTKTNESIGGLEKELEEITDWDKL